MMAFCRIILFLSIVFAGMSGASGQNLVDTNDPREMALDIYGGINRGVEPATIALKLRQIIELFRYRCTRVTDYQIFTQRPNITDIKVKCSGDPLYGVTVASNGFSTVYGGNSILAPLDRRDAVILSFDVDGGVEDTSGFDQERIREETLTRVMLGGEYDYLYLLGMLLLITGLVGGMVLVFLRIYRRKQGRRKPRGRMKPMKKFRIGLSSDIKDRLVKEAEKIGPFVYRHHSGLYVAIGRRGKRRLFLKPFWAKMYARFNFHYFEATEEELSQMEFQFLEEVETVDEGQEVPVPGR